MSQGNTFHLNKNVGGMRVSKHIVISELHRTLTSKDLQNKISVHSGPPAGLHLKTERFSPFV